MATKKATAKQEARDEQVFSYDEAPYESYSYRDTHPDHLYVVGKLFGLNPPDFRKARVLELGCAAGGNLIPYALSFPQSQCVGIDLSGEEIGEGNRIRLAVDAKNVELLQKNIMDIGADFGTFDYIIAHGVFSWVPEDVRGKILNLCRDNLSENGLVMLSYNAYPGWHAINALRDMMRYHTRAVTDPLEKVRRARSFLAFIGQNAPKDQDAYKLLIEKEVKTLSQTHRNYLYHDHLAEVNQPFYLHEFADLLAKQGLQYIGDTSLPSMYLNNMGATAQEQFSKLKGQLQQEQYIDFILNRRFRMSVIAHADARPDWSVDSDSIFDFHLTANVAPVGDNPGPHRDVSFKKIDGPRHFETKNPVATAFFLALCESGRQSARIDDLAEKVKKQLGLPDTAPVREIMAQCGIDFAFSGFINLHAGSEDFLKTVSKKPVACAMARVEVRNNPERRRVTTSNRYTAGTNKFSNILLGYCDGTNDVDALTDKMLAHVKNRDVTLLDQETKKPMIPADVTRAHVEKIVKKMLQKYADSALLTG